MKIVSQNLRGDEALVYSSIKMLFETRALKISWHSGHSICCLVDAQVFKGSSKLCSMIMLTQNITYSISEDITFKCYDSKCQRSL